MDLPSAIHICIFTRPSGVCLCLALFLGHKHKQKRHKPRRRPVAAGTTVSDAAPVVSAGMFSDLESLSSGLADKALLGSTESGDGGTGSRPSNDSSGDSGPHRRSKRFLSYPRFVEVMLVADSRMVEHHGSNLQHYVLTLMSIVSLTFFFSFPSYCVKLFVKML